MVLTLVVIIVGLGCDWGGKNETQNTGYCIQYLECLYKTTLYIENTVINPGNMGSTGRFSSYGNDGPLRGSTVVPILVQVVRGTGDLVCSIDMTVRPVVKSTHFELIT